MRTTHSEFYELALVGYRPRVATPPRAHEPPSLTEKHFGLQPNLFSNIPFIASKNGVN